jgi:TolB-like protein/tetratricopeptide (TPR) repeat protein
MSLFNELKRRNVFRVGVAYIVAAWVFLQVADLVLDAINAPDWVLQVLMLLIALGFVAALIIAWAYELTPEGVKRERDMVRDESITHQTANKLNHITIALVLAGIAVVVVDRLMPERSPHVPGTQAITTPAATPKPAEDTAVSPTSPDENSVAVLPFVNMSSDPEQAFFSDGISEEILNVLTRIPGLKVAARTSSFQFKGQNLDIADIARQLKVNHILEGSVRKAGDQLRITAQLIEAQTGYHLWSDTFDRKLEDVFAIQDEIAGAIAGELRARLSDQPLETSKPVDMRAYELYLKGRSLVATRRGRALIESIGILQSALEIAPEYAPAMATLAKAYAVIPWFTEEIPPGDARKEARNWAVRALEIEPNNSEALSVMGVVHNEVDQEPEKAIAVLKAAIDANPGSVAAHNFLGDVYTRISDLESAMFHESKAAELDPLGPVQLTDLANVYLLMGNYDKVLELADRALQLDPAFSSAVRHKVEIHFIQANQGELEKTIEQINQMPDARAVFRRELSIEMMILEGDYKKAAEILEEGAELARGGKKAAVATAFEAASIGNFDIAGEMLLLAQELGDGTWTFPLWVRLPEQAPDSLPWQEFWRQPGPARFAELRRRNGLEVESPMPFTGTEP